MSPPVFDFDFFQEIFTDVFLLDFAFALAAPTSREPEPSLRKIDFVPRLGGGAPETRLRAASRPTPTLGSGTWHRLLRRPGCSPPHHSVQLCMLCICCDMANCCDIIAHICSISHSRRAIASSSHRSCLSRCALLKLLRLVLGLGLAQPVAASPPALPRLVVAFRLVLSQSLVVVGQGDGGFAPPDLLFQFPTSRDRRR